MKPNTSIALTVLLMAIPALGISRGMDSNQNDYLLLTGFVLFMVMAVTIALLLMALKLRKMNHPIPPEKSFINTLINELDESGLDALIKLRADASDSLKSPISKKGTAILLLLLSPAVLSAQAAANAESSLMKQPGILITIVLITIPLLFAVLFLFQKVSRLLKQLALKQKQREAASLTDYLYQSEGEEIDSTLIKRKSSIQYMPPSLVENGHEQAEDHRGILNTINQSGAVSIAVEKKKQPVKQLLTSPHASLILWYLGSAVFWLLFGTTVGEYLGIKFVAPESDSISWLSFGRLRPVHTNAVFWGWSSLAMIGLAYYVVPTVSNSPVTSIKMGWASLILINASVIMGSICLMAGINNGGGEYREYIWPVMSLFGLGLIISLINFLQTIANRKSKEIYISNWYIVSAIIFTLIIAFIAYWPTWQNGLGETIVQGYYMHQGVGMWFMLFNLGLVYYFLPQQINKPIYSYGLGILAFWSQILFYTLIGTHHFVFSSIPWWLQTVAIVGSAGMIIPVVAGTTNFFMTFKGSWNKLSSSYTLPFFFVGILFYFTGSLQGTAEAFRYTNLLWHFTDFTVAHSHLTMYGIIAFLLWGCIYVVVPRITGKEPSQLLTGVHFWMAFIGLMFYTIPLMIGGTLKGLHWMEGGSFIESITLMAPYWLWRAIGGTLMWISHLVFAFNFYKMIRTSEVPDVKKLVIEQLREKIELSKAY
jgi:cytochrome c oxidase cbb3-type subunit 1